VEEHMRQRASSRNMLEAPKRTGSWLVRRIALFFAFAVSIPSVAIGAEPPKLQSYNAAIAETSVSGISSGAFMAAQFGTAWSSVVKGAGIVAGGPFYCAQAVALDIFNGYTAPVATATAVCMKGPPPKNSSG
jgi:hypothetical protein